MRHYKIGIWIFILSIANFALGAPTATRERLEVLVDVDVAKGERATPPQKRYNPPDDASTTTHDWPTVKLADHPSIPPSLTLPEVDHAAEQPWEHRIDRHIPPTPGSPTESVDSNPIDSNPKNRPAQESTDHAASSNPESSNPEPPMRPHLPVGPTGGYPEPPMPLSGPPGPSDDRYPSRPGWSETPGTSSSYMSTGRQAVPQNRVGGAPLPLSDAPPSVWDGLLKGLKSKLKRRISGPGTVYSAQRPRDSRSTNIPALMILLSLTVTVFDRFLELPRQRHDDASTSE